MDDSTVINCDVCIIGAGMTGMAAALFAGARGLDTLQVGRSGETMFASGLLDLLGVHPVEQKKIWRDPWAGLDALVHDIPRHPYARLKKENIGQAFSELLAFLEDAGVPYRCRPQQNVQLLTPLGTLKTTYGVPRTMWPGVEALVEKRPCLLVDIRGLKGFSARQMAMVMQPLWPELQTARISFPGTERLNEVYAEQMALALELGENRRQLAQLIRPHVHGVQAVGLPAILGLSQPAAVVAELAEQIGVPVFEIPTMPPAIAGLRLRQAFEGHLPARGVRLLLQKQVIRATAAAAGGFRLEVGNTACEQVVKAGAVILATGRFLGKGLQADRRRIRETVFDLPVSQPPDREKWHRQDFLDSRGHPINQAGLEIDDRFRPLDDSGRPAHRLLFAAGSILAHQDWMRTKCGSGLAIATAYAAVKALLRILKK